jgi:hypothetical protein
MKADREFGGGDGGGGPEDLRTILRQWRVPAPSPDMEEELRRTFRRGRSRMRRLVGLALAASLFVAAAFVLRLTSSMKAPDRVAEPAASVSPSAAGPPIVESPPADMRGPVHASSAPAKRSPTVRPARNEVVVEPGQAELLAELARQLKGTRQGEPGVSLPRIEVVPADAPPSAIRKAQTHDEVPEYRARWESIESEWPFAHWSL